MTETKPPAFHRLRRLPERASYDAETIYAIIDAAPVCHVAFVEDGQPFSIPTNHARTENRLLFHGSPGSRLMRKLRSGEPVCVSFAIVDGIVAAKSIFHHSVNYRSAVVFGRAGWLEGQAKLLAALRLLSEKILPGRWDEVRPPSREELRQTAVAALEIEAASAKHRAGMPGEEPEDEGMAVWSGLIPLRVQAGPVVSVGDQPLPPSVQGYMKRINGE